ncbi:MULTISPECIES: hypothetical protein [unclassified Sphingobacterium]|uniref:hypothetical protein n=1 Tax=unclassified Sphingobacterium TaxID=2609468 RepID=UPI0025F3A581|nr:MULTISPECIES: hypothetical protein [unclassified Sphingobacterium]
MEKYFNTLHFCIYRAFYKVHLFTERINPVNLIHKLPFQRKRYEELGIDIHQEINKAWGDKRFGLSTVAAGGFLWGGLALFFFSVLMMLKVSISTLLIIGCGVGSGLICYAFVFRQDKYIKYFDRYEKWSKQEKRKYGWLTVGSILFVLLSFYFCLLL